MEPEKKTDDIPPLSNDYHKARRQYALFAALLLAWELIGLRIDENILADRGLKILSPQAIPIVLIVLLAYFAYRTTIEWHQSDVRRRSLRVSRYDFRIAHVLAVIALGVFSVQRMLDIQLVDKLERGDWIAVSASLFSGFCVGWARIARILLIETQSPIEPAIAYRVLVAVGLVSFVVHPVTALLTGEYMRLAWVSGSFVAGIILIELTYLLFRRFVARTSGRANGESPAPPTEASE